MAVKISIIQILALFFPHLVFVSSLNFSYPAVFNFGDSNSDTGGLVAGIAFPLGLPMGQTYFHESSGRFCDGRLIIDFLMNAMGQPFLSPYLDSIGAPDFRTGCNFAAGGATILPPTPYSLCPFSFNLQVAQFIRFKTRVFELLAEEDYFKDGLYMFDMGQNDLEGEFYYRSEDQVLAFIPSLLSQIEKGIQKLYTEGARNFWVHNTGPLGCLPRLITTFGKNSSELDQLGCVKSLNNAAALFNLQLRDFCTKFQEQFSEVNVTFVDIFSIKLDLISNYSEYGFKEPLAACCGIGGPPLNFDPRINCGQTKNLDGSIVTAKPCSNSSEYVNWDGTHYTEAANRHVFEQILKGNYSYPLMSMNEPLEIPVTIPPQ
ncbi:GDSL esterase/lipase At1g54790-like isoform X2 [Pistacia vera]|uniref:GDSL esterase/lipase At1g54790-like isoform X2 n=1 Tax=Pistacia vera TaxID=55513 RepID=UPI001263D376|nr:GDSL esterase/lipase At1g54790-like isoform X2 [Pistacia vera]